MIQQRLRPSCKDGQSIETEEHFIFSCVIYNNLREIWLNKLVKPDNFSTLGAPEKFRTIYDQAQNIKVTAQFLINCYLYLYLYKSAKLTMGKTRVYS